MSDSRLRSILQSIFRVRLRNSSSDVANGNSTNDNSVSSGDNLLNLDDTNELLMLDGGGDGDSAATLEFYSEVMGSILMEVLTLMSAGKFPPGVKKKEHVSDSQEVVPCLFLLNKDIEIVSRNLAFEDLVVSWPYQTKI